MKGLLAACAHSVVLDNRTNLVSIIEIYEDVTPSGYPVDLREIAVLFLVEREPSDEAKLNCSFKVKHRESEIHSFPVDIDFQDKQRSRLVVNLHGLVVTAPGPI